MPPPMPWSRALKPFVSLLSASFLTMSGLTAQTADTDGGLAGSSDATAAPSSPFNPGPFIVSRSLIPTSPEGAPRPLLVFAPAENFAPTLARNPGNAPKAKQLAPVVVFLHGFNLKSEFYSQLLTHVASHGFYAVAPEMYSFCSNPDASAEIRGAADVITWLKAHFQNHLPAGSPDMLTPDTDKICIAGHSRGGKEAFGVALKIGIPDVGVKAVIVLDPVDGMSNTTQTPPPILKHQADSLDPGAPVLVLGTGLGPLAKFGGLFPPCAPEWVGHRWFFSDTSAPVYHLRAPEFGHMDFLDDVTGGFMGRLSYVICRNGSARAPMRTMCGGVSVSFLKGIFADGMEEFRSLLSGGSRGDTGFPVLVDEVELKEAVGRGATHDEVKRDVDMVLHIGRASGLSVKTLR